MLHWICNGRVTWWQWLHLQRWTQPSAEHAAIPLGWLCVGLVAAFKLQFWAFQLISHTASITQSKVGCSTGLPDMHMV